MHNKKYNNTNIIEDNTNNNIDDHNTKCIYCNKKYMKNHIKMIAMVHYI